MHRTVQGIGPVSSPCRRVGHNRFICIKAREPLPGELARTATQLILFRLVIQRPGDTIIFRVQTA